MNDPKLRVCFMSNAIIYIQNNLFCAVKICRQNEHSRTVSVNAPRERVFLCTFLFRSGAREVLFCPSFQTYHKTILWFFNGLIQMNPETNGYFFLLSLMVLKF